MNNDKKPQAQTSQSSPSAYIPDELLDALIPNRKAPSEPSPEPAIPPQSIINEAPAPAPAPEESSSRGKRAKVAIIIAAVSLALLLLLIGAIVLICNHIGQKDQLEEYRLFDDMGLLAVGNAEDKWGYINKNGDTVIEPQFDHAYPFTENGLAVVSLNGKYGYINSDGEFVIEPTYAWAEPFDSEGCAVVRSLDEKFGAIDENGDVLIPFEYDGFLPFNDYGLAGVQKAASQTSFVYGLIDRKGNIVLPIEYESISNFSADGYAIIRKDGSCGLIDSDANIVIELGDGVNIPRILSEDKELFGNGPIHVHFTENKMLGFVDKNGNIVIEPIYESASDFGENGLAAVCLEKPKWQYINKSGDVVIDLTDKNVTSAGPFNSDGLAEIYLRSSEGLQYFNLINEKGELLLGDGVESGIDHYVYDDHIIITTYHYNAYNADFLIHDFLIYDKNGTLIKTFRGNKKAEDNVTLLGERILLEGCIYGADGKLIADVSEHMGDAERVFFAQSNSVMEDHLLFFAIADYDTSVNYSNTEGLKCRAFDPNGKPISVILDCQYSENELFSDGYFVSSTQGAGMQVCDLDGNEIINTEEYCVYIAYGSYR